VVEIFRRAGGRGQSIEKFIAYMPGVQDALDKFVFDAKAIGDAILVEHHHDGHAQIETTKARLDRYVILSDERGAKAALSIEFGRASYEDPETGEEIGGMDGLFILHRATGARRPGRGRVSGD
jgi:hypothetical protein